MTKVSLKQQQKIRELVLENTVQQIYDWVLNDTLQRFPKGFWSMPENYDYAGICVNHLIEDILKWDREKVCENFNAALLSKYKLRGMLDSVFKGSAFNALNNAYPGVYKPWELNNVPRNYWDNNTASEAVKWLLEDKLHYNREQICTNFSKYLLIENGLETLIHRYTVYDLINLAYPDEFKPWELPQVSDNYWNDDTIKEAIKWLLEDKFHYNREQICEYFSSQFLIDNKLSTLKKYHTVYELLNITYPNEYKPWELRSVANDYWNEQTIKEVLQWLLKEKLHYTRQDICDNFSRKLLRAYGLSSLLASGYTMYELLNIAFPNEFTPTELRCTVLKTSSNVEGFE